MEKNSNRVIVQRGKDNFPFFGIGGRRGFWWFQENKGRQNSKRARRGIWRGTRGSLGEVVGYFQTRREII